MTDTIGSRDDVRRIRYPGSARLLVSISDAAQLAAVSRRTVYNWMTRGLVEWTENAGGRRLVFEDTLFREVQYGGSRGPASGGG